MVLVERRSRSQQPQAFAENLQVKEHLAKLGKHALPFIFINDELKITIRYPREKELFALVGIDDKTVISAVCWAEGCRK